MIYSCLYVKFKSIVLSSNVLCWTFLYMYIYNLYSRTYVGNIDPLKVQRWTMARYQVWSFCDTWWALYVILRFHVFHWNVIIMCWEELNTWLDESPRIIHVVGWIFYVVIWYFAMYAWLFPLQWVMSNVWLGFPSLLYIVEPMSYVKRWTIT